MHLHQSFRCLPKETMKAGDDSDQKLDHYQVAIAVHNHWSGFVYVW